MPSAVVLMTRSAPATAALRSRHGTDTQFVPNCRTRSLCSIIGSIGDADLGRGLFNQRRHNRARRAAGADNQCGGTVHVHARGSDARRFSKKPNPSVFDARIAPSGANTSVFAAPIRRAEASTTSARSSARSLCGSVTLTPQNRRLPGCRSRHQTARLNGQWNIGSIDSVGARAKIHAAAARVNAPPANQPLPQGWPRHLESSGRRAPRAEEIQQREERET